MSNLTIIAKNAAGDTLKFTLYADERQYGIGEQSDISLHPLILDKQKEGMYPTAGYFTYIDGCWYFRSAKGFRRRLKMVKFNGKPIDSRHADVRVRHGHVLSFGEYDEILVTIIEEVVLKETLKDRTPKVAGLFDRLKIEFESLNDDLRKLLDLPERATTTDVMSQLEKNGLFNAAYKFNLARGLRNIVAHPSPGVITNLDRQYIYDSLQAIEFVRKDVEEFINEQRSSNSRDFD